MSSILMKKMLVLLVVVGTLFSCKKTAEDLALNSDVIESNILVTGPKISENNPEPQGDGIYNLLGYGYDVTGKYADVSAVRGHAVNAGLYAINNPDRFELNNSDTTGTRVIQAKNAEDFAWKISTRLKQSTGFKFFKAELTTPFANDNPLTTKYVYGSYTLILQHQRVKIMELHSQLQNYLTPAFKTDLKTMTAEELVKKYGTHILSNIILGAKLNVLYQASTKAEDKEAAQLAGFTYALKKVFNLATGALDPINENALKTISSPKLTYDAVGADITKLKPIFSDTLITPAININDWQLSASKTNAQFVDIDENGLIPLYDLIADSIKKEAVREYIRTYLAQQQVKLIN